MAQLQSAVLSGESVSSAAQIYLLGNIFERIGIAEQLEDRRMLVEVVMLLI